MSIDLLPPTTVPIVRRGPLLPGLEPEQLVRLQVDQYASLVDAGVIAEGAPIERLNGVMRWKNRAGKGEPMITVGKRHAITVNQLHRLLTILLQHAHCFVQVHAPVSLTPVDEPEPDICIVAGAPKDERRRRPTPEEIALLIEVADSSLDYDRGEKLEAYAAAGVPEYWIVNLIDRHVEVYQRPDPASGNYVDRTDHAIGELLTILMPDGDAFTIEVGQFLN